VRRIPSDFESRPGGTHEVFHSVFWKSEHRKHERFRIVVRVQGIVVVDETRLWGRGKGVRHDMISSRLKYPFPADSTNITVV